MKIPQVSCGAASKCTTQRVGHFPHKEQQQCDRSVSHTPTHLIPEVRPHGEENSDSQAGSKHGNRRLLLRKGGDFGLAHSLLQTLAPHLRTLRVIDHCCDGFQAGDQPIACQGGAEADDEQFRHGEQQRAPPLGDAEASRNPSLRSHFLEGIRGT